MSPTSKSVALSPGHEEAWRLYLRSHALLVKRLDSELREQRGFTLNAYDALAQLSEAPGRRLRMTDLADALVYSRSGLTRVVDSLEAAGLAQREADPTDRRATLVVLTKEGLKALKDAWPVHVRGVHRYWADHVSKAQAGTIAAVSRSVIEASSDDNTPR